MWRRCSILFLLFAFQSCGKSLPDFTEIDLEAWKGDKNACGEYRSNFIGVLQSQKEKFLTLDQQEIIALLGRPDQNELYKRNQKFFYYYLTPSQECTNPAPVSKRLAIRFNAMGLAKEVAVE